MVLTIYSLSLSKLVFNLNMKTLACLIFQILILYIAKGDADVVQHVDLVASAQLQNLILFTRVEHVATINYTYQLVNNGPLTQYPGMDIIFNLTFDQYVNVEYNLIIDGSSQYAWLSTRVKIDDVQIPTLRRHIAYSPNPAVTASNQIWIAKGSHRIKLYYIGNLFNRQNPYDWSSAYLKIFYYKQNSS